MEVRGLERLARTSPVLARPIVFYGSSSLRLWSSLAEDLGEPGIINLGFGGSTMAACAHFFERLVVPRQPKSLVLYAGDNDLGDGRPASEVVASFRELRRKVDTILGPIPFTFISIKPSPARWPLTDAIRSVNHSIKTDLESRQHSDYVDVFSVMLGSDGRPRPELYAEDGLHLSREGYRVWAEQILLHRNTIF
jgi:lysophospholipase L1-like esterase